MSLRRRVRLAVTGYLLAAAVPHPGPARADALDSELGRNEVRVLAAPHVPEPGTTILGSALPERLERLGAHQDLFARDHLPPGRRLLLPDPPLPVVE